MELTQGAHGGERPHLDGVDAVAAQVEPLEAIQVEEAAAIQAGQTVVGQLQLPQERQAHGKTFSQSKDPVPAQVQFLQELQLGEASVLHHADVVVLQQKDAQLSVFAKGVPGDDGDVVVAQVQEFSGGWDSEGQLDEEPLSTDDQLQVSVTVAARLASAAARGERLQQQQEDKQKVLHGSTEDGGHAARKMHQTSKQARVSDYLATTVKQAVVL